MELVIEIILWVVVAPVVEILVATVGYLIAQRWKWHPLKNKFDKTITDATDNTFVMIADSATKSVQILALVFAIFGYVLGIALPVLLFVTKHVKLLDFIFIIITFQVVMLPMLIIALHCTTKKIYFSESEIFIKSIIFSKKININQIDEVTEINYTKVILMLLIKYNNGKKLKIKQNFSNYELAKQRFINMNLMSRLNFLTAGI